MLYELSCIGGHDICQERMQSCILSGDSYKIKRDINENFPVCNWCKNQIANREVSVYLYLVQ